MALTTLKVDILARAISVRIVFLLHSVICTWRVVDAQDDNWRWALLLIPLLLIPEGFFTLKYSKNGEWQTFRPCIFIYLSSVVPNIWVLEYDILQNRLSEEIEVEGENVTVCTVGNDIDNRAGELLNITIGDDFRLVFPSIRSTTWSIGLQQALLFILIVGRWTLPRGHLGHQRLSNLLLLQIGMAADILDFLSEGVRTDEVACFKSVVIGTLVLWSASLLQLPFYWDKKIIQRIASKKTIQRAGEKIIHRIAGDPDKTLFKRCSESEIWDIGMAVFLQDFPFLCMRLYFLFKLDIFSQTLLFFIAKNVLVLVLQFYRVWALLCLEMDADGDVTNKFANRIHSTLRRSSNGSINTHNHDRSPQSGDIDSSVTSDKFKVVENAATCEKNAGIENGKTEPPSNDVAKFQIVEEDDKTDVQKSLETT